MVKPALHQDGRATVSLAIKDRSDLHDRYMPFTKNGGLFLAGHLGAALGDELELVLTLLDEPDPLRVAGKVVWLAGEGVKSPHRPGAGVAFTEPDSLAKDRIEASLGAAFRTDPTATM